MKWIFDFDHAVSTPAACANSTFTDFLEGAINEIR
jgi:hypothetical protein